MKATLEFNLPEENEEYRTVSRAREYLSALLDIKAAIRRKIKYEDLTDNEVMILEELRELLPLDME